MRCPACELDLLTVEVDGIEIDFCADGHGQWLDEGELEALMHATEPILRFEKRGVVSSRRCPRCRAKMREQRVEGGIDLDVCPRGDGIWFDGGELRGLAAALAKSRPAGSLAYLDETLSRFAALF